MTKPSQFAINYKPRIAWRLQSGNYFCKNFAHCRDCVQLNYLENWTLWAVPVSVITQVDTLLLLFVMFQGLFSVTSANMWVVLVNFWLGLTCHAEETSSYTDTRKIWTVSSHVRVHEHQEESLECLQFFLAAHFLPSDFIHLSDGYLDNTSFQYCIFGHKGRSTKMSVVLNCEQGKHKWDLLWWRMKYVKDKTFRNTACEYFSMAIIIAAS